MSEMENQTIVEDNAAVLDEEFDEATSSSEEQQPDPKERMLAILESISPKLSASPLTIPTIRFVSIGPISGASFAKAPKIAFGRDFTIFTIAGITFFVTVIMD